MQINKDNQREEIAYIAGLIDGEGTIRLGKFVEKNWNPKYNPALSFVNTNLEVVELVKEFIKAERVYVHDGSKKGFKGNKPCYKAVICGTKKVIEPLEKLLPYLRIKKKQAELVLKYCREYKPRPGRGKKGKNYRSEKENIFRESIYQQIKRLNQYKQISPATTERKNTLIGEATV